MDTDTRHCDHCDLPLTVDRNGYWVGPDETSDCPADDRGHEYLGTVNEGELP